MKPIIHSIINYAVRNLANAEKQMESAAKMLSAATGYDVIGIRRYGVHLSPRDLTPFRTMENVTIEEFGKVYDYEISGDKDGIHFFALLTANEAEEYKQGA